MNALEIKNLHKSYKTFCLDNVNFTLPCGCIMGLIGENGAGKSTLLRLIMNMSAYEGSIKIWEKDSRTHIQSLKENIGYVPDEIGISDCLTAMQVNKIMKNIYKNWNEAEFFSYLARLSVPQDKAFGKYSRGMKMKLGISIAMSHSPKLLILDEATNGLDPIARDIVSQMLCDFTRDETHSVLISSHIVSDLEKICDYIAFLHKGKMLLCKEKDLLIEEYGAVHCTNEEFSAINPSGIIGCSKTPYGINAVVKRDMVPNGMNIGMIDIEQLFVTLAKED